MTSRAQQVRSSSNRICEKIAPTHSMWEGCGCRCDDQHFDAATRSSVGTRPPCSLPWRTSTAHQACSSRYGGEIIKIIQIIAMSTSRVDRDQKIHRFSSTRFYSPYLGLGYSGFGQINIARSCTNEDFVSISISLSHVRLKNVCVNISSLWK